MKWYNELPISSMQEHNLQLTGTLSNTVHGLYDAVLAVETMLKQYIWKQAYCKPTEC
jgi:hypothetical protein